MSAVPGVRSFDLLARAVRDHLATGREVTIDFVRDDGYRASARAAALVAPYWKWPEDERGAIREARGPVLDVGCGAGRVARYLERKGLAVVGIDPSPAMRDLAAERGVGTVLPGSVMDLPVDRGPFRTVLFFGNNFGLAGTRAATGRLLRSLHRLTTADGRILASCITPGDDRPTHWPYLHRNLERGREPGELRLRVEYGGRRGDEFPLYIVGWDGMAALAHAAGWRVANLWANRGRPGAYSALLVKEEK